ncbi:hypothetical protein [Cognataquiflexum rubidum]|uniref:hypothetical protein n=1 Tax=Cognataquiflexum rubidum TaxID=2922273 RepID=UPI001F136C9E|nr:hypothetical protein [Cognataquiflexum rubidum]MCH6234403.1 hypothetical protein [Cognataquiflexum rubidum]
MLFNHDSNKENRRTYLHPLRNLGDHCGINIRLLEKQENGQAPFSFQRQSAVSAGEFFTPKETKKTKGCTLCDHCETLATIAV